VGAGEYDRITVWVLRAGRSEPEGGGKKGRSGTALRSPAEFACSGQEGQDRKWSCKEVVTSKIEFRSARRRVAKR